MNNCLRLPIETDKLPEIPYVLGKNPEWKELEKETDRETVARLREIMSIAGIEFANVNRKDGILVSKGEIFRWEEIGEEIRKIFPDLDLDTLPENGVITWPLAMSAVARRQDEDYFFFDTNRLLCDFSSLAIIRKDWGYDQLAWAGRYGHWFAEQMFAESVQKERKEKKKTILQKIELGDMTMRIIERILSETNIGRFTLGHYSLSISKKQKLSRKDLDAVWQILDQELKDR